MIISKENTHTTHLPERNNTPLLTQPIVVRKQTEAFVAICQRDGGHPDADIHRVLVEKADVKELAKRLLELAEDE